MGLVRNYELKQNMNSCMGEGDKDVRGKGVDKFVNHCAVVALKKGRGNLVASGAV